MMQPARERPGTAAQKGIGHRMQTALMGWVHQLGTLEYWEALLAGTFFVYKKFCGGSTQSVKRAKAGYHYDGGILPFVLICFISRSQHPLQYSLRENSP